MGTRNSITFPWGFGGTVALRVTVGWRRNELSLISAAMIDCPRSRIRIYVGSLPFVTSTLAAGSITRSYNLLRLKTISRHINNTPSAQWRDPEQSCPIRSSTLSCPAIANGLQHLRLSKRKQRGHQRRARSSSLSFQVVLRRFLALGTGLCRGLDLCLLLARLLLLPTAHILEIALGCTQRCAILQHSTVQSCLS